MDRPTPTRGMRHVALHVRDLSAAEHFYVDLLGMQVEWRPDADNLYLTSGADNLALHASDRNIDPDRQSLDHIGFILAGADDVDDWYDFLSANGVEMKSPPRTHRDGARSFYCVGPEQVVIQMIYHPPIAGVC